MEFLLFPIFGFFIFMLVFSIIMIKKQKTVSEQQNRQQIHEQEMKQAQTSAPAHPAVQDKRTRTVAFSKHAEQAPGAYDNSNTPKDITKQSQSAERKPVISFTGDEAVKGILYAEIIGKPKALR